MKNVCWMMLVLCCSRTIAQKPTDCTRFREGTFKMTYMGKETRIVRKGNQQSQYFDNAKTPLVFKVKWVDDCTCKLIPAKPIANHPGIPPNAVMTIQIVKTRKNSYTQITTANFTKQAITGEIFRVE